MIHKMESWVLILQFHLQDQVLVSDSEVNTRQVLDVLISLPLKMQKHF